MADADGIVLSIYDALFAYYGDLQWWPAQSPYEVIVGAVLVQNTAWGNVQRAIANFDGCLHPQFVADAPEAELAEIIRPSGCYNQKARYLKAVTAWFAQYDYDVMHVCREPLHTLRGQLLQTKGIGNETADAILLYAFGFATFVIDAYTVRLCARCPIPAGSGYRVQQAFFEARLPKSVPIYKNCHAMIVECAKDFCRKKPLCGKCPLAALCEKRS